MDRIPVDMASIHHLVSMDNRLNANRGASLLARATLGALEVHGVEVACFWTHEGHVLQGRVGDRVAETDPVRMDMEPETAVQRLADQLLERCAPLIDERNR